MEAEALAKEAEAKEAEHMEHIKEMEEMGYDMTDYKNPPSVTTDEKELARAVQEEEAIIKGRDALGCNQECDHCIRTHCQFRKTKN